MHLPRHLPRAAGALALLALGALAGRTMFDLPRPAHAEDRPSDRRASMEVLMYTKNNEALVFVYDEASHRLLMYTTAQGSGGATGAAQPDLKLAAVRNTAYDARIEEYRNKNENGMSVKELKEAFEEQESKEREAARKKAEDEAKKARKEGKG